VRSIAAARIVAGSNDRASLRRFFVVVAIGWILLVGSVEIRRDVSVTPLD
jgi:hypothetical protein